MAVCIRTEAAATPSADMRPLESWSTAPCAHMHMLGVSMRAVGGSAVGGFFSLVVYPYVHAPKITVDFCRCRCPIILQP